MSEKNGSRDWELTCDHCNGCGRVIIQRQVAERKSDVQEFKEECECCEGRGFTIAFEDIPGIAEYVRKSRPAPSAPGDAQDDPIGTLSRDADETIRFTPARDFLVTDGMPVFSAPAAGDALPTIKGAAITGGYVVVTPAGWGEDKAQKVRDAILRLFPVNPAYTPKPEDAHAQQQGEA